MNVTTSLDPRLTTVLGVSLGITPPFDLYVPDRHVAPVSLDRRSGTTQCMADLFVEDRIPVNIPDPSPGSSSDPTTTLQ